MSGVEQIGGATLYLGDCREILPSIRADALVTDAPYGINDNPKRFSAGRSRAGPGLNSAPPLARNWPRIEGDAEPFDPAHLLNYKKIVLCGANHFASRLPDASKWIIWDKREGRNSDDGADCELIWTNLGGAARVHRQLWRGHCMRGEENAKKRLHQFQKPVALMDRLIEECRLEVGAVVLDPYMGSGTTGIAALRRGLAFIGIEKSPAYFDTACERIAEDQRQHGLFDAATPAPS